MADVTLFGPDRSTNVRTVRMALHEKTVDYHLQDVDFATMHGPDYRRTHHPFEKVPVLRHGNLQLYETAAILRYIDETFPGPALQPATPAERARMTQWQSVISAYLYPTMIMDCVFERMVVPRLFKRPTDEAKVANAVPRIEYQLGLLEAELAHAPYLAGAAASLADFLLVPILTYLSVMPEGQKLLPKAPLVTAWQDRMASRPSFVATRVTSIG